MSLNFLMKDFMKISHHILKGWCKFIIGSAILAGAVYGISTGYTPPGILGEVVRHNQEAGIDASPFFYGDVENMTELEEGLKTIMEKAKQKGKE